MILICVPAGEFLMGSADADFNASPDEKPQHTVYLDAYWIDQTEVTNAQYALCVTDDSCPLIFGGEDNYPVVGVIWQNAVDYCTWAGRQLPSEAQWEKAARGMDGRLYPWGNQPPDNSLLKYDSNGAVEVGLYPAGASPYGALDMAGNVWEWTADWYDPYYYDSQEIWVNPIGPDSGNYRVLRSGSWPYESWNVRSADRYGDSPFIGDYTLGFRCCLSVAP